MITVILVSKSKNENEALISAFREEAARQSEEMWKYFDFTELQDVRTFLDGEPTIDLCCWDISGDGMLEALKEMRARYRSSALMLLSEVSTSPMLYLRPGVSPNALLLKPYKEEQLREILSEFVSAALSRLETSSEKELFVIETRDTIKRIPYHSILYFEAREKKIFLRTKSEEYGFYSTIDTLAEKLPEGFRRCHRSFIVNIKKIKNIDRADGLLLLTEEASIPFSRSYRKEIQESLRHES